jgi:hypothetical protein
MLNSYPMSDPTLLLFVLLSRRLKPGHSPVEQRVMLIDGPAAVAIGQLVLMRQPMLDVPLNIRDGIRGRWHVVTVPIGTPLRDVCEQLNISTTNVTIRAGDVLRDVQIDAEDNHRDFGTFSRREPAERSGESRSVHPLRLVRAGVPVSNSSRGLLEAAQSHDMHLAERYGLQACIECGICSYCLPLTPATAAEHPWAKTCSSDRREFLMHLLNSIKHGFLPLFRRLFLMSVKNAPARGDDCAVAVLVECGFGHLRGCALRAVAREEEDGVGQTLANRLHRVRLRRADDGTDARVPMLADAARLRHRLQEIGE